MSKLRTVTRTRPARGFGVPEEEYEQLQVKHDFCIYTEGKKGIRVEKIRKPIWEDVPHAVERGYR